MRTRKKVILSITGIILGALGISPFIVGLVIKQQVTSFIQQQNSEIPLKIISYKVGYLHSSIELKINATAPLLQNRKINLKLYNLFFLPSKDRFFFGSFGVVSETLSPESTPSRITVGIPLFNGDIVISIDTAKLKINTQGLNPLQFSAQNSQIILDSDTNHYKKFRWAGVIIKASHFQFANSDVQLQSKYAYIVLNYHKMFQFTLDPQIVLWNVDGQIKSKSAHFSMDKFALANFRLDPVDIFSFIHHAYHPDFRKISHYISFNSFLRLQNFHSQQTISENDKTFLDIRKLDLELRSKYPVPLSMPVYPMHSTIAIKQFALHKQKGSHTIKLNLDNFNIDLSQISEFHLGWQATYQSALDGLNTSLQNDNQPQVGLKLKHFDLGPMRLYSELPAELKHNHYQLNSLFSLFHFFAAQQKIKNKMILPTMKVNLTDLELLTPWGIVQCNYSKSFDKTMPTHNITRIDQFSHALSQGYIQSDKLIFNATNDRLMLIKPNLSMQQMSGNADYNFNFSDLALTKPVVSNIKNFHLNFNSKAHPDLSDMHLGTSISMGDVTLAANPIADALQLDANLNHFNLAAVKDFELSAYSGDESLDDNTQQKQLAALVTLLKSVLIKNPEINLDFSGNILSSPVHFHANTSLNVRQGELQQIFTLFQVPSLLRTAELNIEITWPAKLLPLLLKKDSEDTLPSIKQTRKDYLISLMRRGLVKADLSKNLLATITISLNGMRLNHQLLNALDEGQFYLQLGINDLALSAFQTAANKHIPDGIYYTAAMMYRGLGQAQNKVEAMKLIRHAAALGSVPAQAFLKTMVR